MLAKRVITTLTFNQGVLFRTRYFEPDYRYTKSFIDTWSVDEIIILDISRKYNNEIKKKFINLVRKFSENSFVPLTIGGKIKTLKDVSDLMNSGADKVSINTKALQDPSFISEVSSRYGSQAVVISIDVKKKAKNMRYLVIMGVSQLVFHHSNGQKNVKKWEQVKYLLHPLIEMVF